MKTRHLTQIYTTSLVLLLSALFLVSCQGRPSEDPPIHLNPNMDNQPKYLPQETSEFFVDGATMRTPVEGTVAIGELRADDAYYRGKDAEGNPITEIPVNITLPMLKKGQERFDIYCSPCHGRTGDGQGIVVKKGFLPPPSFHEQRVRDFTNGHIYDVITNGIRNMPSYRHQISVEDRWAIVGYVRALQRSHNATIDDVPQEKRESLQAEGQAKP